MNKKESARICGGRIALRARYFLLAVFLSKRFREIETGELSIHEKLDSPCRKDIEKLFGTARKKGQIQRDVETVFNGILTSLKQDFPYFTPTQIQVFSYLAAGMPYYFSAKLSGLKSLNSVWVMKTQMEKVIVAKNTARKQEYLMMLRR